LATLALLSTGVIYAKLPAEKAISSSLNSFSPEVLIDLLSYYFGAVFIFVN
jgi:hypothetical protein